MSAYTCCAVCGASTHAEAYDCDALTREARLVAHRGRVARLESAATAAREAADAAKADLNRYELSGFEPGRIQELAKFEISDFVASVELPF